MENKIKAVSVVTAQGASTHYVGDNNVDSIEQENVLIDGNPYMHYVGRDKEGIAVFKISATAPVEVIYQKTSDNAK
jgi:hypothetical protein